jgi:hypothetical protein
MKEFVKDFLHFEKLITPQFIQYIFWLMLLGVVVGGIGIMFVGYYGFTFKSFLIGLFTIAIGAVAVRIWSELLIVLFKMNEALQEIKKK